MFSIPEIERPCKASIQNIIFNRLMHKFLDLHFNEVHIEMISIAIAQEYVLR